MGAGGVAALSFPWALWCPLVSDCRIAPASQREELTEKGKCAWGDGRGFSAGCSCSGLSGPLCAPGREGRRQRPVLEEGRGRIWVTEVVHVSFLLLGRILGSWRPHKTSL